ncbi:uncharacterized protein METZ01_LOCUS150715, partial [marine metagenome]
GVIIIRSKKARFRRDFVCGSGRNRTSDTRIFSPQFLYILLNLQALVPV